jgi:8-oxo-dGTP pyrophosphatase MutT (NUDIX family)
VSRTDSILRVARLEARCAPKRWAWAEENRDAIEANWERVTAGRPGIFNGRVLLMQDCSIDASLCRATYFEADFKDFLAWRDLRYPDPGIGNGYAMGALQDSDGAYVCGVMGAHTANSGRIYFPSGTPDPSDLRPDGTVDLATSVIRELEEETALPAELYEMDEDWTVVSHWPAVAFMRLLRCREPAEIVARRIRAAIAKQDESELADARVIRGREDVVPDKMPVTVQDFFRWAFGA